MIFILITLVLSLLVYLAIKLYFYSFKSVKTNGVKSKC